MSALLEIGLALKRRGDTKAASQTLVEVIDLGEAGEHRVETLVALDALRRDHAQKGQLYEIARTDERALRMIDRWGGQPIPLSGIIYVGLGNVHCEWNNLEEASQLLNQGLKLLLGTIEDDSMTQGYITLSRVQQAQGDSAGALASILRAETWLEEMQIVQPNMAALLAAHRTRLWLRQGNLDAAIHWATATGLQSKNRPSEERESEYLTLVRVLFVLSAAFAAVAGSFLTHYNGGIGPSEASVMKSVRYVAIVAVGGMAHLWGALLMGVLLNFMSLRGMFGTYDDAVFGAILIVIMLFAPNGILGLHPVAWLKRLFSIDKQETAE